jgi:hypothetical protein
LLDETVNLPKEGSSSSSDAKRLKSCVSAKKKKEIRDKLLRQNQQLLEEVGELQHATRTIIDAKLQELEDCKQRGMQRLLNCRRVQRQRCQQRKLLGEGSSSSSSASVYDDHGTRIGTPMIGSRPQSMQPSVQSLAQPTRSQLSGLAVMGAEDVIGGDVLGISMGGGLARQSANLSACTATLEMRIEEQSWLLMQGATLDLRVANCMLKVQQERQAAKDEALEAQKKEMQAIANGAGGTGTGCEAKGDALADAVEGAIKHTLSPAHGGRCGGGGVVDAIVNAVEDLPQSPVQMSTQNANIMQELEDPSDNPFQNGSVEDLNKALRATVTRCEQKTVLASRRISRVMSVLEDELQQMETAILSPSGVCDTSIDSMASLNSPTLSMVSMCQTPPAEGNLLTYTTPEVTAEYPPMAGKIGTLAVQTPPLAGSIGNVAGGSRPSPRLLHERRRSMTMTTACGTPSCTPESENGDGSARRRRMSMSTVEGAGAAAAARARFFPSPATEKLTVSAVMKASKEELDTNLDFMMQVLSAADEHESPSKPPAPPAAKIRSEEQRVLQLSPYSTVAVVDSHSAATECDMSPKSLRTKRALERKERAKAREDRRQQPVQQLQGAQQPLPSPLDLESPAESPRLSRQQPPATILLKSPCCSPIAQCPPCPPRSPLYPVN